MDHNSRRSIIYVGFPVSTFFSFQAQSDDDDVGAADDMAVNMGDGKMDEFFAEVEDIRNRRRI